MKPLQTKLAMLSFMAIVMGAALPAQADYAQHRLSVGAGIVHLTYPSETDFALSAEYEYRFTPMFGAGVLGSYIFSSSGIAMLGAPVFFHPFSGDLLFLAAPIVEFGSGITTQAGVRLGTRVPLPLGVLTLIPSFAIDFIAGGRDYIFGLGIQI